MCDRARQSRFYNPIQWRNVFSWYLSVSRTSATKSMFYVGLKAASSNSKCKFWIGCNMQALQKDNWNGDEIHCFSCKRQTMAVILPIYERDG